MTSAGGAADNEVERRVPDVMPPNAAMNGDDFDGSDVMIDRRRLQAGMKPFLAAVTTVLVTASCAPQTAAPTRAERKATESRAGVDTSTATSTPHAGSAARSVVSGNARFSVLTPAVVRLEWSASGAFEGRPSFTFTQRDAPPTPEFTARREAGWLILSTDSLELRYREGSGAFGEKNLRVQLNAPETPVTWHPGMPDIGNLGGTVRTLDMVSGATPLGPGLLSRDGWVVVDDSATLLLDESGWPTPRRPDAPLDWYFFGHGHDYQRALADYTALAGPIPLPPRWTFGSWWSRYWAYSEQELRDLVAEFAAQDVPLDVLVVDMDWHLEGWTGYTWNRDLFPDPEKFLAWAHEQELQVTLNLHPHDGVGKHEAAFPAMARALSLDPATTERIPFDVGDPDYMRAYFEVLHHSLEKQGVDFWWVDWQQGAASSIPGLDPLFWLNVLHWRDMETNEARLPRRPLIFSRWGGLGNHRYQIGFSGDTFCNWESLAFQPHFTATAGNVCYPYWSHDIGGHQPGPVDGELYARWIQFAAFNPFLRTHATKNPGAERRIWKFGDEVFGVARDAFRLRYALLPYIYTTARETFDTSLPMLRPLYYEWPEEAEAYERGGQYLFGAQLMVAPVAVARDATSGCATTEVWIPPGTWHHWFTGEECVGPRTVTLMTPLEEMPVFATAGAIIPTATPRARSVASLGGDIAFDIFPGPTATFDLYEDDGDSTGYQTGETAITRVVRKALADRDLITVEPVRGTYRGMPARRDVTVRLRDVWRTGYVEVNGQHIERRQVAQGIAALEPAWYYDTDALAIVVRIPDHDVRTELTVRIDHAPESTEYLRAGLRGRANMARSLARAMGDAAPEALRDLAGGLGNIGGEYPTMTAMWYFDGWSDRIRAVAASDAPEAAKRQALLRMMGLAVSLEARGDVGGGLSATVRAKALRPLDGATATVEFEAAPGWVLAGAPPSEARPIAPGEPFEVTLRFQPDGAPRPTTLAATLRLDTPAGHIDVPLERDVLPSIHGWWIVGPFDTQFETQLDPVYPPEEGAIDLAATYRGKGGADVAWRRVERTIEPGDDLGSEFYIDLNRAYNGPVEDAIAYATTGIIATSARTVTLALGSDDGVVVWLNGEELHRNAVGRPYTPKQDRVALPLRAGRNTLLLKIGQGTGGWSFGAHLEDADGSLPDDVWVDVPAAP